MYVTGSLESFPVYITPNDLVPLYEERVDDKTKNSKKSPKKKPKRKKYYHTWLNETTINAIVLYSSTHSSPKSKTCGPIRKGRKPVYLGSSYNIHMLRHASENFLENIRQTLRHHKLVALIINVGNHWNLLTLSETKQLATLYDPMATSSINLQILVFAARVFGKVDELNEACQLHSFSTTPSSSSCSSGSEYSESGSPEPDWDLPDIFLQDRSISVRTQLNRYNLSFFELRNVGIQLVHEEGHNCGLYCALWARSLLTSSGRGTPYSPDNAIICKYSKRQLVKEREQWQDRLAYHSYVPLPTRIK